MDTAYKYFEDLDASVTMAPDSIVSRTLRADAHGKSIVFGFDAGQDTALLRAGMSVTVDIDTGRRRSLWSLLGWSGAATTGPQP